MSATCRTLLTLLCLLAAPAAMAETVARWVDADGVTHFGDPQFAPAHAKALDVAPTNGMEVPQGVADRRAGNGPRWSVITRAPKQNKKGWRSGSPRRNAHGTGRGRISRPAATTSSRQATRNSARTSW